MRQSFQNVIKIDVKQSACCARRTRILLSIKVSRGRTIAGDSHK